MKMNKLASVFAIALGMSAMGVQAAEIEDQGRGTVTFYGSIIDAPCSISPESSNQEVYLGQVAAHSLDNKGRSTPETFTINLENCALDEDKNNTISITFGGANLAADPELLGIAGSASGAGVAIASATGEQIELGKKTLVQNMIEGPNTLLFSAWLQGLSSGDVVPGEFTSIADFTMQYD